MRRYGTILIALSDDGAMADTRSPMAIPERFASHSVNAIPMKGEPTGLLGGRPSVRSRTIKIDSDWIAAITPSTKTLDER
jgi:hypothetical protein